MRNRLSEEDRREIDDLRAEVVKLRVALSDATTNLAESKELRKKELELSELEKQIVQLQIQKDKINEDHARERRDIEHKVGLEKTRQEQELSLGKREAIVEVQESNLSKDQTRFEEQMKFNSERFDRELSALREILTSVLETLPSVTEHVSLALGPGQNGNGDGE